MKNLTLVLLFFYSVAGAQTVATTTQPRLLDNFWKNVSDSFSGSNLWLHAAGVGSTGLLIKSGVDAEVHETFRHHKNDAGIPGSLLGGGIGAATAALWLYFYADNDDKESLGGAFVIVQATAITLGYVSLLKGITGRPHPNNYSEKNSRDQSEEFRFGFLRGGVIYGWPSGHVSHTVAVTSALAHYYPHKPYLAWVSVGLTSYMLYTVSAYSAGQMHWFSDGVAGAFTGYAIGSSVGKNFRHQIDGTPPEQTSMLILPVVGPSYIGAMAAFEF